MGIQEKKLPTKYHPGQRPGIMELFPRKGYTYYHKVQVRGHRYSNRGSKIVPRINNINDKKRYIFTRNYGTERKRGTHMEIV